jgi:urease accessory protein
MRVEGVHEWQVWQWVDSALPGGGFAHSAGLEAAVQLRQVTDRPTLRAYLEASLEQTAHSMLPLVTAAHREPERLVEWDALCEAFLRQHVANRASRLQGRAIALTAEKVFGLRLLPDPMGSFAGHLAPLVGTATGRLGFPLETAQRLLLFWHLRGLLAAAMRLNRLGPLEAQDWQRQLGPLGEALRERGAALGVDDLCQTAPLQELWQGAHDRLTSRLFQS